MDLMKLLKAKTENHIGKIHAQGPSFAEKILTDLQTQFDTFLKDVAKLEEFKQHNPLEGVRALRGELLLEDDDGVSGKSPYLFLRLPGRPGLLLEPGDDDSLRLTAATEARPIQRKWNGDVASQVVFVRRQNPLAVYTILDEDVVRHTGLQKTMMGAQFFEHLVETLILQSNESLG